MKKIFNHTCGQEKVYEKYYIESSEDNTYIIPDLKYGQREICPFDNADKMVFDYLTIGYMAENGVDTTSAVFDFVSTYGMPKRNSKKLNAEEFSEDANVLYLHFQELSAADYPDEPEWILEAEPVSAIVKRQGRTTLIDWQTKNLASAIELAYTLLVCSSERYIGLCKHCKSPFLVKNPKSEFCSPACRNRYNVYKSRAKQS